MLHLRLVQIKSFRQIKIHERIFEKVASPYGTNLTQKRITPSKIFYYYIIGLIMSYLYSFNIGRGKCVEYWVVLKK
jgi:hypothetical protein